MRALGRVEWAGGRWPSHLESHGSALHPCSSQTPCPVHLYPHSRQNVSFSSIHGHTVSLLFVILFLVVKGMVFNRVQGGGYQFDCNTKGNERILFILMCQSDHIIPLLGVKILY